MNTAQKLLHAIGGNADACAYGTDKTYKHNYNPTSTKKGPGRIYVNGHKRKPLPELAISEQ